MGIGVVRFYPTGVDSEASTPRTKAFLLGILLCVLLLYIPGTGRWVQGDDFFKYQRAIEQGFEIFRGEDFFFRPLENFVHALNLSLVGPDSSILSLGVSLAGILISTCLVFAIARRLLPGRPVYPLLAAGYFALHSSAVSSVIQIDTISQQYATVFALGGLLWSISGPARGRALHFAGLVTLWFLCLASKETGFGLVCACPLAVLFITGSSPRWARTSNRNLLLLGMGASALALAVYFLARSASDADLSLDRLMRIPDGDRYQPTINPITILGNTFQLVAVTSYIGSSLDFFPSIRLPRVLLSSSITLIAAVISLRGLSRLIWPGASVTEQERRSRWATLSALLVLCGGSMVPAIALGKVSELYSYALLPFVALALAYLWVMGGERLPDFGLAWRVTAWSAVLLAAIWMAIGVKEKVDLAVRLSARSREIFVALDRQIGETPPGKQLTFCAEVTPSREPEYSIFFRSDPALAAQMLPYLSRRHPEREIRMAPTPDCTPLPVGPRKSANSWRPRHDSNVRHPV